MNFPPDSPSAVDRLYHLISSLPEVRQQIVITKRLTRFLSALEREYRVVLAGGSLRERLQALAERQHRKAHPDVEARARALVELLVNQYGQHLGALVRYPQGPERGRSDAADKRERQLRKDHDAERTDRIRSEAMLLLGDGYLRLGRVTSAFDAYCEVGGGRSRERLVRCAERCLEDGWIDRALESYAAAGIEPVPDRVIACGDALLGEGRLDEGRRAYGAVGHAIPREKLIACGDAALGKGGIEIAVDAYAAAKDASRLLGAADAALATGNLPLAREAYRAAGEPLGAEKILAAAQGILAGGEYRLGRALYGATGACPPLELLRPCGDAALRKGWLGLALESYEAAGLSIPDDLSPHALVACGDRCLEQGWTDTALEAYTLAARSMDGRSSVDAPDTDHPERGRP